MGHLVLLYIIIITVIISINQLYQPSPQARTCLFCLFLLAHRQEVASDTKWIKHRKVLTYFPGGHICRVISCLSDGAESHSVTEWLATGRGSRQRGLP